MINLSFTVHCFIGFMIRIILIIYANFHDELFLVPYTDVDYKVFSDAARFITQGKSPFDRHTYRYTPLLAIILTPNIYIHKNWGKFLFSLIDIFVSFLIKKIVIQQKLSKATESYTCAFLWLYNPLTIIISTRGNADSLAAFLVLLSLFLLQNDYCFLAGILHGLSIHFRLYPLAFSLSMYLYVRKKNYFILNKRQLILVISCILSLLFFTAMSYFFYGYKSLYESVIYHLIRKDTRHNFSVYFYMLYLTANVTPGLVQRILTFLPQLILLIALSIRYSSKNALPFALLTQAIIMVTYNPVMTSQYLFWFLSLLPVCLPAIKMSTTRVLILSTLWIFSQGLWLYFAYLLEFQGINSFTKIWLAGIVYFAVNIKVLLDICNATKFTNCEYSESCENYESYKTVAKTKVLYEMRRMK